MSQSISLHLGGAAPLVLRDAAPVPARQGSIAQRQALWFLAVCALVAAPLWLVDYVPAADMPAHSAMAQVIWRLLSHDALTANYYALRPHSFAYFVAYALLTPCVGLLGPVWGSKLALTVCSCATVGATRSLLRAAHAPRIALVGAFFAFYGLSFYCGFFSTLVGLPPTLACYAFLLRWVHDEQPRDAAFAAAAGTLAVAAHVVWLPAVALGALIAACLKAEHRAWRWIPFTVYTALGAIAVMGMIATNLRVPTTPPMWLSFDSGIPGGFLPAHLGGWNADRLAMLGHGATLLVLVVWHALHTPRHTSDERQRHELLWHWLVLLGLLHAALPNAVEVGATHVWLLGFRTMPLFELVAIATLLHDSDARRTSFHLRAAVALCMVAYAVPMAHLWRNFNAQAGRVDALMQRIPANQTVYVDRRVYPEFRGAWPALNARLPDMYLARNGAFMSDIDDVHAPIISRAAPDGGAAPDGTVQLHTYDWLIQYPAPGEPGVAPADGTPSGTAAGWILYERTKLPGA